jgi:hypothetical protein
MHRPESARESPSQHGLDLHALHARETQNGPRIWPARRNLPNNPTKIANLEIGLTTAKNATEDFPWLSLCKSFRRTTLAVSILETMVYMPERFRCTTN